MNGNSNLCRRICSFVVFLFLGIVSGSIELTGLDLVEDNLVGSLEGVLESLVESELSGSSLGLLGGTDLGSLVLEGSNSSGLAGNDGLLLGGTGSLGVGVKLLHDGSVLERVLLGLVVGTDGGSHVSELGLNGIGVDDSGKVSTGEGGSVELVASLGGSSNSVGTEDGVKGVEGVLGEDHESSEVTTRGELEEVESVDIADIDTGEVSSGSLDKRVLISVDNKRSLLDGEAAGSEFANTGSGVLVLAGTVKIIGGTNGVEGGKESLGGLNVEGVNNEGELGDVLDVVTSGLNERSHSGSGKSGSNSVSLLVGVDLSVPFSPGTERGEHTGLSAHVTESSLSGSVGTGTSNSRNTGNGTTSSPGLSGVLLSLHPVDSMSLSSVLGHVGVNEGNGIVSDGGRENSGHVNGASNLSVLGVDGNDGVSGHL